VPPPPPPPTAGGTSIGDYVWNDLDGDGIQDSNEPGVANVNMTLRACGGRVIDTATTDGNGRYLFTIATTGSYKVQAGRPSGSTYTVGNAGSDRSKDSNANGAGISNCVNMDGTQSRHWIDFGLRF